MLSTYLSLLHEFIAFRSISTDEAYKDDSNACADRLISLFDKHGFQTTKISGYGNPLIVAHYEVDPSYQTILIYGHYDVQPAEQNDGWQSDPFSLDERDGRLYARGAADNKWQVMIHIATVLDLIEQQRLGYNITFFIEWDEETGLPSAQALLDHRELLHADVALLSDGVLIGDHTPTIMVGLRGWGNVTVTIQTAMTDLHSGLYGNIATSASHIASRLVAQLYDANDHITIPWWYDDIDHISDIQKMHNALVPRDDEEMMRTIGAVALAIPQGYDAVTANGLLPTIQVTGVSSGYTGVGYKNIIPGSATMNFNFRFAPGQDPEKKMADFGAWITNSLPTNISHQITISDYYPAISISTDHPLSDRAKQMLQEVYGISPIMRYCGATLPMAWLLQDTLWLPVMIIDLANEDCNIHGVDENISLTCIEKGLRFSERLLGR
jgi:acetylornithine deacetylase/succinyl-diaminopimelate desuccinylase-like protein